MSCCKLLHVVGWCRDRVGLTIVGRDCTFTLRDFSLLRQHIAMVLGTARRGRHPLPNHDNNDERLLSCNKRSLIMVGIEVEIRRRHAQCRCYDPLSLFGGADVDCITFRGYTTFDRHVLTGCDVVALQLKSRVSSIIR